MRLRASRSDFGPRVRPLKPAGGGWLNLWRLSAPDRWAWFIRKKLKLNPKSPPGLKRWNSPNLPARAGPIHVCFSNRPFGVKRFQTIHHHSVDVAHGLVLLFGIGTKALPVWDSKTRRNNLSGGLAVSRRQNQADMRTHLIHRPARDILPLLGGARVSSYRIDFMDPSCCCGFPGPAELGAIHPYAVHDHGQPTR